MQSGVFGTAHLAQRTPDVEEMARDHELGRGRRSFSEKKTQLRWSRTVVLIAWISYSWVSPILHG
jgi:hypothetical protein